MKADIKKMEMDVVQHSSALGAFPLRMFEEWEIRDEVRELERDKRMIQSKGIDVIVHQSQHVGASGDGDVGWGRESKTV